MSTHLKHAGFTAFIIILVIALFTTTSTLADPPVRDLTYFLKNLCTLAHLPVLEDSHTAMASTWDRTGANNDGTDYKRIENSRNILLETDGPSCIHRVFVGIVDEHHSRTRFQVFLDHKERPQIDLPITKLYDYENGPIPYPLVFCKSYPGLLLPIPFEKHVLICLTHPDAEKPEFDTFVWSNYWQLTYTKYQTSVKVKSLTRPLSKQEKQQIKTTCDAWLRAESTPPQPPQSWAIEKTFSGFAPREMKRITHPGTGIIRQIRLSVDPATTKPSPPSPPSLIKNLPINPFPIPATSTACSSAPPTPKPTAASPCPSKKAWSSSSITTPTNKSKT